jgi:hypothetical protein
MNIEEEGSGEWEGSPDALDGGDGLNGEGEGGLNEAGGGGAGGGRRRGEWAAPGGVDGDGEAAQQPGGVVRSEAVGGTGAKC